MFGEQAVGSSNKEPSKMKRGKEIAAVLAHYGIDFLAESRSPLRFLISPSKLFQRRRPAQHSTAEGLRLALEELGPTYIKLGQAASTRPDLVPPEYVAELTKLQDSAPEVRYADIAHVVKEELGFTPETKFACFEKEPLGTASLGQVHAAILPDGSQVIVKVQKPHIQEQIAADLKVLHDVANFVSEHTSIGRTQDVKGWLDEFEFTLQNELDYTREARNADRFRNNFENDDSVYVPRVYWEYTCPRVLTMERIEGIKISNLEELDQAGLDRRQLARTCALVVLKMVYDHGFFHADPHAGNFFVLDNGRLALIDCGMVGRVDKELKDSLMRIALAVSQKDADQLTDEVMSFAYSDRRVLRQDLKRDITRILLTHMESGTEKLSMARMLNDTLTAAAKHGLELPSAIALLARTFTMAEGMGAHLDPEFNLTEFAEPYLRELFTKRYSTDALMERAREEGPLTADLLLRLPKRAERMLSRLERGEFAIVARLDNQDDLLRHLHVAANRISMSMLSAGLIGAMSVLTIVYRPAGFHGWSGAILLILLLLVCMAGISLLLSIWRAGKKEE
jgi:ubiquinone biosynthesis protein